VATVDRPPLPAKQEDDREQGYEEKLGLGREEPERIL
jgi:hypothetical protein